MSEENAKIKDSEVEALVYSAQEGDQDAFAKLYDHFIDQIYRYVYYRVQVEDVEDIVENVFLKVWENLKQYKPQQKSFSAWVFRIAHNLVVDHYRAAKDKAYEELSVDLPDVDRQHHPIRITQNRFDNETLKKAMAKLKKQYHDIILYKFINDLSNSEIAEILGKSEGSLRILQFRALKALRKELEELGVTY
jgi:RNA polymerase sigma-70 factor (ECF subfamily)